MYKLMLEFDEDDENGENKELDRLLHRISVIDFLLYQCNFAESEFTNDELSAIKKECNTKVLKILKNIDLDSMSIYQMDDEDKIIKYKFEGEN